MIDADLAIDMRADDDSVRACVASMLHVPYEQTPDVLTTDPAWGVKLAEWLKPRHYNFRATPGLHVPRSGVFLVQGPADHAESHVVLMRSLRGRKAYLYHDPHPSRAGLQHVRFSYRIVKYRRDGAISGRRQLELSGNRYSSRADAVLKVFA